MKASEKLQALAHHAHSFGRRWSPKKTLGETEGSPDGYPRHFLDIIVFHKLHLVLRAEKAIQAFRSLKDEYVDWNEVRVSSVREIQESLGLCAGSLELSVFIKDLLELLHRERQDVSLEFLAEKNLGEIRQFLKHFRGFDAATGELLLHLRKDHPVFPLNHSLELVLTRLGILKKGENRSKIEKELYEQLKPSESLLLHHFLLNHAIEFCPPDESAIKCPSCSIRQMCAFFARAGKRQAPRGRSSASPRKAARHRSSDRAGKPPGAKGRKAPKRLKKLAR